MFQVTATNSGGIWNQQGVSIPVIVLPPFYATWWFRAATLLAAVSAMRLAWLRRIRAMKQAHAAQQAFSRQLIATQENERKRIAAELHDSLGQRLTIINNLALLYLKTPRSNGDRCEQIEEISAEASLAMREVREISYDLRPYQLDRLGLTKAIEGAIRNAGAASSIVFSSAVENIDDLLPSDSRINLYRIVQECLNNIVKHSQATQADVAVWREDGRLLLTVADDGKGFTSGAVAAESRQGGFGLMGISERARLLGGKADVRSSPGKGVQVIIEIDLKTLRNGT
jgi:signal transduction histidine kinase